LSSAAVIQAPAWLVSLATPLIARYVARELTAKYPGLGPGEIREKMLAEVGGVAPNPAVERFIDETVARISPAEIPASETPPSAWVLVLANLVPLAGVLFWSWDAFALIALFWMENVVVGVFFLLRVLLADPRDPALWAGKLFMIPFFGFHYGMFTAGHGVFVFDMLGGNRYDVQGLWVIEPALRAASDYGLWLPVAVLVASHFFSFAWNYLYRGEFRRANLGELMSQPYKRVVVLHIAILLGGFAAMALGSPLWALIVLLALKIGLDLKAHVKEHSKA
jgi:hypothetical protein